MTRGSGSLFVATRSGLKMTQVNAAPTSPPGPTWWAHHCAEAWTAAWLTARGREFTGPRELQVDPAWSGEIRWRDAHGRRSAGHRPDLLVHLPGGPAAIEVELARKSVERLRAILELHDRWRLAEQSGGVIYVCADQAGADRIRGIVECRGLLAEGGLRVELLGSLVAAAREARAVTSGST